MPGKRQYYLLFFLSGATSLAYEIVFYKLLGYLFGNTIWATTTVLTAFMGGLAIGSWLLGPLADRVRRPMAVYGLLELLIGLYALAVPFILSLGQDLYVGLCADSAVTAQGHVTLRFVISVVVLVFPTVMMGGTLPLLARAVVADGQSALKELAALYSANTLGAAVGTFISNYLLIRLLGIYGALALAAAFNLYIFVRAMQMSRQQGQAPATPVPQKVATRKNSSFPLSLVLLAAFLTGANAFALEVVWTHLLAVVVGTSVYAFGMMLFTFLLAIGAGAWLVSRNRLPGKSEAVQIGMLQLVLGLVVLLTLPVWPLLPAVFTVAGWLSPGFWLMETFRLLVCLLILLPACLCLGATFPLLLRLGAGNLDRLGSRVGVTSALNTLGCIVGAVFAGFWLVVNLGSRWTLGVSGAVAVVLGLAFLVPALGLKNKRVQWATAVAAVAVATLFVLPQWNYSSLISGANVYFDRGVNLTQIISATEDTQSGVVTVSREPDLTLRTNGKFEGNDGREMHSQHGLALIPVLYTPHFGHALNIGLGTGVTAGALSAFPFESIEVLEFSPRIIEASSYFTHVNFDLLNDPRVKLFVNDGRNHLLLSNKEYDLITVAVTSIWFAGAGNLYNSEFYQLASSRMAEHGVLQQWLQLHHMSKLDLLVVLNTVRHVFPYVSLWVRGGQGIVIATKEPQKVDFEHLMALNRNQRARPLLKSLKIPDFMHLLGALVLDESGVASALSAFLDWPLGPLWKEYLVSSDMFPYLEYSTPMGNALKDAKYANLAFLERHDRHAMPTLYNVPDEQARRRAKVLYAHAKGRCGRALLLLQQLDFAGDEALEMVHRRCRNQVENFDF